MAVAQRRRVRDGLPIVSFGLGLLYLFLASSHFLLLPIAFKSIMTLIALSSATVLLAASHALKKSIIALRWSHPLAAMLAAVVMLNALGHLFFIPEPKHSTNVALTIIGIGCFFLSWRWFCGMVALTVLLWLGIVFQAPASDEWLHFGFMLVQATLLATLVHAFRMHATKRLTEADVLVRQQALTFAQINDGVLIADANGHIIDCNPASVRLFGDQREMWLGQLLPIWLVPEARSAKLTTILQTIKARGNWNEEVVFASSTGVERICDVMIAPIYSQHHGLTTVLVFIHDLTNHKRATQILLEAKEQSEQAHHEMSAFVSMVVHEVNTALTSISGYTQLLQKGAFGHLSIEQQEASDEIMDGVINLSALLSDLSTLSLLRNNHLQLNLQPLTLTTLCLPLLKATQEKYREKHQVLEFDFPKNMPIILGDRTRIVQILSNLISNAFKYAPEHGTIRISAGYHRHIAEQSQPDSVLVSVYNSGAGIKPEDEAQLFQRFFRGTNPNIVMQPGTGLGLHITKALIELHGGTIWFESLYGSGVTFFFTLPIAAD